MYYAKPPVYPDLVFYKELFETFIAYNDRYTIMYYSVFVFSAQIHFVYLFSCVCI